MGNKPARSDNTMKREDTHAKLLEHYQASHEGRDVNELVKSDTSTSCDTFDHPTFLVDPFGRKDCKKFADEVPMLIVALLAYSFGVYMNSLSQAYLQKHDKMVEGNRTILWDIGFNKLPRLDIVFIDVKYEYGSVQVNLPDFMAGFAVVAMIVRFLVLPGPRSMRWAILRRLAFLSGVMFFFRAFTIIATVLPNPDPDCKCTLDNKVCTKEQLSNIFWFAAQVFVMRAVTCDDVLYSGHTVALTMSLLFFLEYEDKAPWFAEELSERRGWCIGTATFKLMTFGYAIWGYVCIIGSRFHYTADVMIGFLITLLVFRGYHHAMRAAVTSRTSSFPVRAINWFESTATDMIVWRSLAQERLDIYKEEAKLIPMACSTRRIPTWMRTTTAASLGVAVCGKS